jgi:REase_DpnII-MboI
MASVIARSVSGRVYPWLMEIEALYEMAATNARSAERMCSQRGGESNGLPFQNYSGYPFYIDEYNRLAQLTAVEFPEASPLFPLVDLQGARNPGSIGGHMWKAYSELAAARLGALSAYLKTKLGTKQQEHEQIIDLITANLRASIYQDPGHEREVQDVLETIFRARSLNYRREKDTVPYSTKRYIPDFTFNAIGLAVEVKLCKDEKREKDMIDEIGADIVGYADRYDRIIFVIYDLGFIRDVPQFRADIEKQGKTHVLVLKK